METDTPAGSTTLTITLEASGAFRVQAPIPPTDAIALLRTVLAHLENETRVALPDGWEATNDGVNLTTTDGVVSYSRTYAVGDDRAWLFPCAADGSPTPATVAAIVALG